MKSSPSQTSLRIQERPEGRTQKGLSFESLESRRLQAQFGIAWTDSAHLTMSYAPDGTTAYGVPSALFASLDAQMPRNVWQGAIQRAIGEWSKVANVNVGIVSDGGQVFGVAGPVQGDRRFGDIRIGGYPMDSHSLAVSIPPSTALNGTFSGDIFINTRETFTESELYRVALHEVGHALGLPHSTNPLSVMNPNLSSNSTLSGADVTAIRGLYGVRSLDLNEGSKGNDTLRNATRIKYSVSSGGYDGSTPLIAYGDLGRIGDRDIFELKGLTGYNGSITFRVQTKSISMTAVSLRLLDESGNLLRQVESPSDDAGIVNLRLPSSSPDAIYYLEVRAKATAQHALGRFAIGVTFDGLLQPTAIALDTVLRGNYDGLAPEKVDLLFTDPAALFLEDDLGLNDTTLGAIDLRPGPGQPSDKDLSTQGSINSVTDQDFYRVRVPQATGPWVLTLGLLKSGVQGILPRVQVFNANSVLIPAEIIVNDAGRYAIQVTGLPANQNLFLRVTSPTGQTGNYLLDVTFNKAPAQLSTFVQASLPTAASVKSGELYVAKTQLFNFVLDTVGAGAVTMRIRNEAGQVVYSQVAGANQTASAFSAMLAPGRYTLRFSTTAPVSFKLRGVQITDPIGPVVDSATLAPQYQSPSNPGVYTYPGGTTTSVPFHWLLFV